MRRVSYLLQGKKLSEEWCMEADDESTVTIDRWSYKLAMFDSVETLARTENDLVALAESRFYSVVTHQAYTPKELFSTEAIVSGKLSTACTHLCPTSGCLLVDCCWAR